MTTKAPNDDARGEPAPHSGRNDPAIDPASAPKPAPSGDTNQAQDNTTPEGNRYSPDFEPTPQPSKPANERDADIDTDGG